jgi:hypothetical protein
MGAVRTLNGSRYHCRTASFYSHVATGGQRSNDAGLFRLYICYHEEMTKDERRQKFINEHPDHPSVTKMEVLNSNWRKVYNTEKRWKKYRMFDTGK